MLRTRILLAGLTLALPAAAPALAQPAEPVPRHATPAEDAAFTAWVAANATPISAAGPTEADLAPIVAGLAGASIVGIGEATHGTHEDQAFKAELIKALVRTGQVRLLLMESNLAPNARLDDYVRAGIGDPADALRDLSQFRNVKGDEFAGLVLWMRAWNLAHPDDMVRIAGPDAQTAELILAHDAARAAVDGLSIFEHGLDPPEGMNRAEYYGRRDRAMARIALRMQQRTGKGAVIWAHDLHMIDRLDPAFAAMSGYRSLGMELEDALGAGYRSIGFSYTEGIVRTTPARKAPTAGTGPGQ